MTNLENRQSIQHGKSYDLLGKYNQNGSGRIRKEGVRQEKLTKEWEVDRDKLRKTGQMNLV